MLTAEFKIGKKIRALRISRGITQKQLAGDKITRNMLSLIESGSASPSVSTLVYLSEKLGIPTAYFFAANDSEDERFLKMPLIEQLKSAFRAKNYLLAEELSGEIDPQAYDDELSYILSLSYMYTSLDAADKLDIKTALDHLALSEFYSRKTTYTLPSFSLGIEYHRELVKNACSDTVSDILSSSVYIGSFVPYSLVSYFRELKNTDDNGTYNPTRVPLYDKHLSALIGLKSDTANSLKKLKELAADPTLPFYMQYKVLSSLEECANLTEDLRSAYGASRKKLEFVGKFRV